MSSATLSRVVWYRTAIVAVVSIAPLPALAETPTFSKDIAPILFAKWRRCR